MRRPECDVCCIQGDTDGIHLVPSAIKYDVYVMVARNEHSGLKVQGYVMVPTSRLYHLSHADLIKIIKMTSGCAQGQERML